MGVKWVLQLLISYNGAINVLWERFFFKMLNVSASHHNSTRQAKSPELSRPLSRTPFATVTVRRILPSKSSVCVCWLWTALPICVNTSWPVRFFGRWSGTSIDLAIRSGRSKLRLIRSFSGSNWPFSSAVNLSSVVSSSLKIFRCESLLYEKNVSINSKTRRVFGVYLL